MKDYKYYIKKLGLKEHSEGGYFKETYLSNENITLSDGRVRNLVSNILFLLTASNPSHFHRLTSDELWFYHAGKSLTVHMIYPDGRYEEVDLGLGENQVLQYTVPKDVIFASSVKSDNDYDFSIVGCVVSPAFSYEDFELFTQDELIKKYPKHKEIIKKLAYESL